MRARGWDEWEEARLTQVQLIHEVMTEKRALADDQERAAWAKEAEQRAKAALNSLQIDKLSDEKRQQVEREVRSAIRHVRALQTFRSGKYGTRSKAAKLAAARGQHRRNGSRTASPTQSLPRI